MEKIKTVWRSIPIWVAFILITVVFVLLAAFATSRTNEWAFSKMTSFSPTYHYDYTQYGDGVLYEIAPVYDELSDEDKAAYQTYQAIYQYSAVFWYSLFLVVAALLFYGLKLKKPLAILSNASRKIADNDLDFRVEYSGHDEFAKLCVAFETMRSAVQQNNIAMWRSVEERKRVNSAFAHDLRTPVTVMKGYADMLQNYMPEQRLSRDKEIQTVSKIRSHISRLEQYIESMSAIQKLEDLEITPAPVDMAVFVAEVKEAATIICSEHGKRLSFDCSMSAQTAAIDRNVFMQIFENMIANAVCYSQSEIHIEVKSTPSTVTVSVRDDGKGFSAEELQMATRPYYKGENGAAGMHFGLGLYICKLLCEKHSGACKLSNHISGGAVVTATLRNFS